MTRSCRLTMFELCGVGSCKVWRHWSRGAGSCCSCMTKGSPFGGGARPDNQKAKHKPDLGTAAPSTDTQPRLVPPIAGLLRTQNQLLAVPVDQDLRRRLLWRGGGKLVTGSEQ